MKKLIIPVVALALTATLFASCKKDYTCTCTVTSTSGGTPQTIAIPISKSTKSDAKKDCDAAKTTYTSTLTTASCGL